MALSTTPPSRWHVVVALVAPLITALLLGVFALWVKSIKTDVAIARVVAIDTAIEKRKEESAREFYPITKGAVLEERLSNISTQITALDKKLEQILQRDYERRTSGGSANVR